MPRAKDRRSGLLGYRPADDPDLRLTPGVLEVWRPDHIVGPSVAGDATVGACAGTCGRSAVPVRPVDDDELGTIDLCDRCLLDDAR